MAAASSKGTEAKEKGNAAFKAGNYAEAIGHYTAAILADPKEPTFPLNRAAAYLKLGKNEDAERDCTKVISLNPKNSKALFRRAQARTEIGTLSEALNDLNAALKIEPSNTSVKDEIRKVQTIVAAKNLKGKSPRAPLDVPAPPHDSHPPHPKRRRVPIKIVERSKSASENTPRPSTIASTSSAFDELKPVSSRPLKPSAGPSSQISSEQPTPKREPRVGGGIFKASGQSTIFKRARDASPKEPASAETPASTPANGTSKPTTLFAFQRAWDSCPSPQDKWEVLQLVPPKSIRSLFQTSLESPLLASVFAVLLAVSENDVSSIELVSQYLDALPTVPRFSTVLLFLSDKEKQIVKKLLKVNGVEAEGVWKSLA